jgi:hypothetical protein
LRTKLAFFAAVAAVLCAAPRAHAAGMDPTPERLVLQPPGLPGGTACNSLGPNGQDGNIFLHPNLLPPGQTNGSFPCRADNVAYANMMSELGFAVAPPAFHPARTTGVGGFALTFEMSFTKINADAFSTATDGTKRQYWHDGTQGSQDPNNKKFSIVDNSPDSLLQLYSLKARKGLPYGFEVTGALGYLANTSLWVVGADIRWAVLEGFRTGALGYFPDISVGGGVRTVAGSPNFYLTTVGIDGEISKPIALADSAILTPYIGYQRLIIFADSTVLSASPDVDPLQQCGYQGIQGNNMGMPGQPICKNKIPDGAGHLVDNNGAFNNNITFDKVRTHRNRGIIGLNYRYELLYLAGQFITDITDPSDENPLLQGGRQWTMSFETGVFW